MAEVFLKREKGGRIVHDPRLTWNTLDIVEQYGGKSVLSKSGHAFIKQVMRDSDAIYGGEMSAHHYFRDFAYADSGMIPWLVVLQVISETGKSLADLVGERMKLFPASGEINRKLDPVKGGAGAVCLRAPRQPIRKVQYPWITLTACPWNSTTGASTCAPRTPSRWCGSTSSHAVIKRSCKRRHASCWR